MSLGLQTLADIFIICCFLTLRPEGTFYAKWFGFFLLPDPHAGYDEPFATQLLDGVKQIKLSFIVLMPLPHNNDGRISHVA
jgi:hypothetical protein